MNKNDPKIKVTNLGKGWGIRLYKPDGSLFFMEDFVERKNQIAPACRQLLRWYAKMGGVSNYAHRARHRAWEKARNCDNELDRNLRNKDMIR